MKQYDIAAFIWPSYTGDEPRTRIFWPEGIGEWQTVRDTKPKFEGHLWPRRPLWGYVNEADPEVMRMQIDAAADHGVNVFIYDWYWYDNRPFLENCLNDGYLKAPNRDRVKFYLMWANHDATTLWDPRNAESDTVVWSGRQNKEQFDTICDRLIEKYFKCPSYYKINGKPVFMIYDPCNLVAGLGGEENARKALDEFREKCVKAGFPGLELQLAHRGEKMLNVSGVDGNPGTHTSAQLMKSLGFDSTTNYQFVHFIKVGQRDYRDICEEAKRHWEEYAEQFDVPYYPHVSVGWDNNPRYHIFQPRVVKNNTPAAVEDALRAAKKYVDTHDLPAPLITINSWNEWTEGSYLEPDDLYGYGYLDAIKNVFLKEDPVPHYEC